MKPAVLLLMRLGAPLAIVLSGCATATLTDSRDVDLGQSDAQRLVVINASPTPLTLARGGDGAVTIAPGRTLTVPFKVRTIGTLQAPSGAPHTTIAPGEIRKVFVELESPPVVDATSPDLILRFRTAAGAPVTASFALNLCPKGRGWEQPHVPAGDHPIQAPDPIPAIPQAVCPP